MTTAALPEQDYTSRVLLGIARMTTTLPVRGIRTMPLRPKAGDDPYYMSLPHLVALFHNAVPHDTRYWGGTPGANGRRLRTLRWMRQQHDLGLWPTLEQIAAHYDSLS